MNNSTTIENFKVSARLLAAVLLTGISYTSMAQNCPANIPVSITTNPDTYYPGLDNNLPAGSASITLGAAGSGTSPIATGDLLLVIQMQGAQIDASNTTSYGDGIAGGSNGYLSNSQMMAGNMEYVVATNAVPLTGGTLTIFQPTTKNYKNAAFGTDGQYRYQIIRVGLYYDLTLGASINVPAWNGSTGGVIVLSATSNLNFNGQTINGEGAGFRGGAGRQLGGAAGGVNTDVVTMSTINFNASKGEGIAGTPRFINNNGVLFDNGAANEGYPQGSYAAGAPGNAGGGGTDGRQSNNDQNSGGGGGANGGTGGKGGNSWSSNLATGGEPGQEYFERSPSQLVMGGGGGSGTTNDGTGTPAAGFSSSGAAGGAIVIITANSISGTGTINVNGANGNTTTANDGSGGGGAGGSVLIYAGSGLAGITVFANGGVGGTNAGGSTPPGHGPGGGGGGGVVFSNNVLNPASSASGGANGQTTAGIAFGAVAGSTGTITQNISIAQIPPQNMNCSVLPVKFKSIAARWQQSNIVINWVVTNEAAIKNYTIEKSSDGIHFSDAGTVAYRYAANGDNAYSFTDTKCEGAVNLYYRIKGFSSSNTVLYSSIVNIRGENDATLQSLTVNPNPATGPTATVRFTVKRASATPVQLRMISLNGVSVWQKQYRATEGVNAVAIDNLSSIPQGVYFLQYLNGQDPVNVRMIVSR